MGAWVIPMNDESADFVEQQIPRDARDDTGWEIPRVARDDTGLLKGGVIPRNEESAVRRTSDRPGQQIPRVARDDTGWEIPRVARDDTGWTLASLGMTPVGTRECRFPRAAVERKAAP